MDKLKDCPFCGEEPAIYVWGSDGVYDVRCKNCPCDFNGEFEAVEKAITTWNTRKGEQDV